MCDEWMPRIQLPLTIEQFHQLPRNAAYKYEYLDGRAWLSPRPRHYHALLDLQPLPVPAEVHVRPVQEGDWDSLQRIFTGAFRSIQPFGSLDDDTRREAARKALERTRTGGDGPWIERASFVALAENTQGKPKEEVSWPVGAVLITLLPEGDPTDLSSYYWDEPPPADCIARGLGRPHLTWIFVSPLLAGQGVGTALLASAVKALLAMGYRQLASTFMIGNDSSMLWHWRNGFRLLSYPGSFRQLQQRRRKKR